MKLARIFILLLVSFFLFPGRSGSREAGDLFPTLESKEQFAEEISSLIGKAWKNWQDSVIINGVDVNGSRGVLQPGNISESVLTASSILTDFDRKGKSQDYIDCVKAVAEAVENGMRSWQRGYTHTNVPFPQGASCAYTMPPTNNVPVTVASGRSSGDRNMEGKALYTYMLYRSPGHDKGVIVVFSGSARAISECFVKWKNSCSIVGILASGGVAPQPAPMGTGPGPVRHAKGEGGKLVGPYIDTPLMYDKIVEYYEKQGS